MIPVPLDPQTLHAALYALDASLGLAPGARQFRSGDESRRQRERAQRRYVDVKYGEDAEAAEEERRWPYR